MNATQKLHKHIYKNDKHIDNNIKQNAKNTLAKAHNHTKKMIKHIATLAFVALFATLNIASSQVYDAELEREIQRLEKQKKILELKRQNKKLQKELDDDSMPTSLKTQNPTSKQNPQNQTPYYAPNQTQKPKKQVVYEEEEEDEEVIYASRKTDVQGFIRVEGGYHIGVYMRSPQVNLELGLNINDKTRVFLGGSYAWVKYNQYEQYIANAYIGIGWIPILFDSPVRVVLDSYLGATFGRVYLQTSSSLTGKKTYEVSGVGFLAGLRTGFAFDIGSHAQLEIGTRIEASIGLPNLVITPYGSFTFLF